MLWDGTQRAPTGRKWAKKGQYGCLGSGAPFDARCGPCGGLCTHRSAACRALAHRACCPICPTLATETQASGPGPTLGVRRPVRCAASLSIGACRLLPRAHGAGDYSARGQKGLQGRLSRQDRQNSAERARSQAELGLRWTTIKATIRICELCRGTRALYPPRSMPVRTHKTGAQLATTGTQDQSQDALPRTMTSPQLSDFVRFHDF